MPSKCEGELDPRIREVLNARFDHECRVDEFGRTALLTRNIWRRYYSMFVRLGDAARHQCTSAFVAEWQQQRFIAR